MAVIRHEQAPAEIKPFSLADVAKQANGLLVRAQERADQMLALAQKAADELKRRAIVEGIKSGRIEGLKAGQEEGEKAGLDKALAENSLNLKTLMEALLSTVTEFDTRRIEFEAKVLREVTLLSLKIADRIVKRQATIDPAALEANLGESLKLVVGMHKLRIVLHPSQKSYMTQILPRLKLAFPTLDHVELIDDETVAPGGCKVITRQGSIDATLDEQLRRIAMDLLPESSDHRE